MEDLHKRGSKKREVPIWERTLLTINEASDYTEIGVNKLRTLADKRIRLHD